MALLEVFKDALPTGNLNVTWVQPGAILAWHRHQQQDDHMLVVQGTLKVGEWMGSEYKSHPSFCLPPTWIIENSKWTVLTDKDLKEHVIPRGWWHGYQNIGTEEALVLTWITQNYNPNDEERLDPEAVSISWERKAR